MELVEGETLETRVRREGPLRLDLALQIAVQVTRALVAAAERGLVHRDLKPGNIMLAESRDAARLEVKVIDFGLAKAARDVSAEMELTHGGFVGTPAFASPEQFAGDAVDVRSDIYALGVTLWFALTGRLPFPGRTIEEIRAQQARHALPLEQLKARAVPEAVVALLRSCLAIDPEKRPASAQTLQRMLESCRIHLGVWPRKGVALALLTAAILIAVLFALPLVRQRFGTTGGLVDKSAGPEKSVAVLPFENLSDDAQNAYFASGVQDEILTNLAKIADLKVISRTSVMQYQSGAPRNLREMGRVLGVAHVVEGSVQRVGDRVRVHAQLIDARTDAHLWAEVYDRELADVFTIQSEIASKIAGQLRARFSTQEMSALAERPTADPKAYQLYTEARALECGDTEVADSAPRQIELLQEATRRDPNFALAYVTLACAHENLNFLDRAHLEKMKQAAETAVRLRPDLGETRLALARSYFHRREFRRAREELTLARRTLPNDAGALLVEAKIDRRLNRWEDAVAAARKASELDPNRGGILLWIGETLNQMRRYGEAEQLLQHGLVRSPQMSNEIQLLRAEAKLGSGDPAAAQSILTNLPADFGSFTDPGDARFTAALYLRDYEAAERVIAAIPVERSEAVLFGQHPQTSAGAQIARARGDEVQAQAAFAAARERFIAKWGDKNKEETYFAHLALLDAGLGRKEEAIREARQAVELMPMTKDSWLGPGFVATLALVYAWTGERDLAIEQLENVSKIPYGPSYGDLRFNPSWDALRGHPRFEKLVASLAPPLSPNE